MQKGENKQSGFTIIEVSLVLAIAGLIFLMVFIALPALQRQSRDTQRRNDILTFLEMTKKYQSNNRGALPSTLAEWNEMKNTYMGDSFKDPDGTDYAISVVECNTAGGSIKKCNESADIATMDHTFHIIKQATCEGEEVIKTTNPKNIAVRYRLEGGGIYCEDI